MNIIVLTNKRGKTWDVEVNPFRLGLSVAGGLLLFFAVAVFTGTRLVDNEISYLEGWKGMLKHQQAEIAATRQE